MSTPSKGDEVFLRTMLGTVWVFGGVLVTAAVYTDTSLSFPMAALVGVLTPPAFIIAVLVAGEICVRCIRVLEARS